MINIKNKFNHKAATFLVSFLFGAFAFVSGASATNFTTSGGPQSVAIPANSTVTITVNGAGGGVGDYYNAGYSADGSAGDQLTGTFTMPSDKSTLYMCIGGKGYGGGNVNSTDYIEGKGGAAGWQYTGISPMSQNGNDGVLGGGGGGGATAVSYNIDCSSPFLVAKGGNGGASEFGEPGGAGGGTNVLGGLTLAPNGAANGGDSSSFDGRSGSIIITYGAPGSTYTVTPSAGSNGTISPNTAQTINAGATTTFTVTPNSGYTATVGGTCGGSLVGTTYTTSAINSNCTVSATFSASTYTVTPSAGSNGTISPNTAQTINAGATTTFTVTPNSGYTATVGGTCGGSLVGTTYTTSAINSNCTVSATFSDAVNFSSYDSSVKSFQDAQSQPILAPTYGNIVWDATTPAGTSVKMRVRTGQSTNLNDGTWHALDSTCEVNNNSLVTTNSVGSPNPCVVNGNRYVQYSAVLNTDSGTNVPRIKSVTLYTQATYSQTFLNLISSPFNSGNDNASVQKIAWTATNDGDVANAGNISGQGTVYFQIRTAPDNGSGAPDWTNAVWCGPTNCSATPNSTSSFASDYYADKNGTTSINSTQSDTTGNRWIQYATFLKSSSGDATPTLSGVTLTYSYNMPPAISNVNFAQNSDGSVDVSYTLGETYDDTGKIAHGFSGSPVKTLLFYQPDNGVTIPAITSSQTGTITLNNPGGVPIPTQGIMMIDREIIEFNGGSGNTINILATGGSGSSGTGRGAKFDGASGSFYTTAVSHNINTPVYFAASKKTDGTSLIHTISTLSQTGVSGTQTTIDNVFSWDARNDSSLGLNGQKLSGMNFIVAANDADSSNVNNVGVSGVLTSQTLDLQKPTIASITTDPSHTKTGATVGYYKAGENIPLTVTFSEPITSTEQINVVLNSGYSCAISPIASLSQTASCTYQVQAGNNTAEGQKLKASSINIANGGKIKDSKANELTNFTATSNLDAATNIVIDTAAPTADDLPTNPKLLKKDSFNQSLTGVSDPNPLGGSGSGVKSFLWSSVSAVSFSADSSSSTNISANADGDYVINARITDEAGNYTDKTLNLIWDTTNPSDAGKPNVPSVTNDNTPDISWGKATDANGIEKYEVERRTGTDGSFSTVATISSPTDANQTYTEETLEDGTYYYRILTTDKAGNTSTSPVSEAMKVDTVSPKLLSFTSNKDNVTPAGAYGINESIDVRAVYDEPLAIGSTVTVQLDNSANPPVDVVLATIEGNVLTGSFTVQGPRKGYDGELNIKQINSGTESVFDEAGNVQTSSSVSSLTGGNIADNKDIYIDTGTPILLSFSAKKMPSTLTGSFKENETLRITALYSKPIASGTITVHFNTENGSEDNADVLLDNRSGSTIYGDYVVGAGDNVESLAVSRIVAQSATDLKGNSLTTTGTINEYNAYFAGLPGESIAPVANISGIKIDTTAPTLGDPAISYAVTKTNSQTPTATINVTDNFDLADGSMQFSLNGNTWCTAVPFATTYGFDITNATCGGNSVNEIKTVSLKVKDKAGNESQAASTTIEYDNSKPVLQKITAEQGGGIYGPGSQIKIIAQYNEAIVNGSSLSLLLNSGKQVDLNTIENGNQLSVTYTVGATGSLEDSDKLRAASIVSQSVSDTSSPTNTQDSTSLAGISENIDSNSKVIIIDTTAPNGTIMIDRSASSGQVKISATDENGIDNLMVEVKSIDASLGCSFTNTWTPYEGSQTTDLNEGNFISAKGCVKFKDKSGNISDAISTITPETPTGIELDDVSNSSLTPPFYGTMLTWQKPANFGQDNAFGQYEELKCKSTDDSDCVPDVTNPMVVNNSNLNYYVNTNLDVNSKYCYQVRFKDVHGNYSKASQTICAVSGQAPLVTDSHVNIISGQDNDILITDITETSAKIIFNTQDTAHNNKPVLTKAIIDVYTDAELTQHFSASSEEADYSVTHIIPLSGLSGGVQYYLKITATDSSDVSNPNRTTVLSYDPSGIPALTFTTIGSLKTISEVKESVVTDTKAVITFKTNQDAKCFIDFKDSLSAVYNDLSDNIENDYAKNHSITLTQLIAKTAYDYKVTCTDSKSTVITSDGYHLTTSEKGMTQGDFDASQDKTAPSISGISFSNITGESATVTWTTNESSSSLVAYELEGTDFMLMSGDYLVNADTEKYATSHTVELKGLLPASKYTFTALSTDKSGNIGQSSQSTFTTKEPSSLSSIKVVSTALGQAAITWNTGSSATSLVEYGLTTAYGQTKKDNSLVKDHTIVLEGLTPGETYHFQVRGEDADKNIFASSDITFQPQAPPKIKDFQIDSVTEHGATVEFSTNVPTNALISYENVDDNEDNGAQGKSDFVSKHSIELRNLTSGATFSIKVKVTDEHGTTTEESFSNFTTTKDTKPPVIDRVKTDSALTQNDKVQAIISWSTDELATGQITYKEGKNGEEKTFEVNASPSFSHVGVITSFKSGVVYYFKVKSMDVAGNEVVSTDYALLTPKQRQNIIQVIIGNFTDIFGWAKF